MVNCFLDRPLTSGPPSTEDSFMASLWKNSFRPSSWPAVSLTCMEFIHTYMWNGGSAATYPFQKSPMLPIMRSLSENACPAVLDPIMRSTGAGGNGRLFTKRLRMSRSFG